MRSQVAGKQPDYLGSVRQRLKAAGKSESDIDILLTGELGELHEKLAEVMAPPPSMSFYDWVPLFTEGLQARLASAQMHPLGNLDAEDLAEADVAREKMCLREICLKYEKMVDRWKRLDPLPLEEAQLEEATRCNLYGFSRATVVLSASALERHLRERTLSEELGAKLIERAVEQGILSGDYGNIAKRHIFGRRNRVVHESWPPKFEEASEVLDLARKIIVDLRSQP